MKTLLSFFALAMICVLPASGQPFSSATLGNDKNHTAINFTVANEKNVRYYRVEASNDGLDYTIIGTVKATGNSMLAKSYHYELNETGYTLYRVGAVGMGSGLQYSSIITVQQETLPVAVPVNKQAGPTGPAVVNK